MSNLSLHLLKALINDKLISAADLSKYDSKFGHEFNYTAKDLNVAINCLNEDNYYSELNKTIASVYSSELLEDYFNNNCFNIILSCIFNEAFKEDDAVKLTELIENKGKTITVKDDIMLYQILLLPIYWVFYILHDDKKISLIKYFIKIKFYLALEVIYKNGFNSPLKPNWRCNEDTHDEIIKLIDESNDEALLQKISDWYKTPQTDSEYKYSYLKLFIKNTCTNIINLLYINNHLGTHEYNQINKIESKSERDALIECITSDYNNISDVSLLEKYSEYNNIITYLLFNRRLADDSGHIRGSDEITSGQHQKTDTQHVYEYIDDWYNKKDEDKNSTKASLQAYYNEITDHDIYNLLYYHECFYILAALYNAGIECYDENDNAITESKAKFTIDEDKSKTLRFKLTSPPTRDVTLKFSKSTSNADFSISKSKIIFDKSNYNKLIPVTFTSVRDDIVNDKGKFDIIVTTDRDTKDDIYSFVPFPEKLTFTIQDVDIANILTECSDSILSEGDSTNISVKLTSIPKFPVTISFYEENSTLHGKRFEFNKTSLTFDKSNWKIPQQIAINAIQDYIETDDQTVKINYSATSNDHNYDYKYNDKVSGTLTFTVKNIDKASIEYINNTFELNESDTNYVGQSYKLTSKPTSNVTFKFTENGTSRLEFEGNNNSITFSTVGDDWKSTKTIKFRAKNNSTIDSTKTVYINGTIVTSDAQYSKFTLDQLKVTIEDDDKASIKLSKNEFTISENGGSAICYVTLGSQPSDDVNITCTFDDSSGRLEISPEILTITTDNWDKTTINKLTFKSKDNDISDDTAPITVILTATSTDTNYNNYQTTAKVTIINDDVTGFDYATAAINLQEGFIETRSYKLRSKPTSNVIVTFTSTITDRLTISSNKLTFTPDNWPNAQNVTFKALTNDTQNDTTSGTITITLSSSDTNYNNKYYITASITDKTQKPQITLGKLVFTSGAFTVDTDPNTYMCPYNYTSNKSVKVGSAWSKAYEDGHTVPSIPQEPYSLIYDVDAIVEE